jgi:hydroxyacylglutathione hydrolase
MVLAGQPDPPTYFATMKTINRLGPPIRGALQRPVHVSVERLADALAAGAVVIDTRSAAGFMAGHLPGSINIPLDRSFSTWAGWLVPFDRDVYLIADERGQGIDSAIHDMAMIGLDRVAGYAGSNEVERWAVSHGAGVIRQISAADLAERLRAGDVAVVDVRERSEFASGRVPGAMNVPVGHLATRIDALPRDRQIVLHCQSGARSVIAASVLAARGFNNIVDLAGGMNAWKAGGYPVAPAAAA